MSAVPVVDIKDIGLLSENPREDDFERIASLLDKAIKNGGGVYMRNHGIDNKIVLDAFKGSKIFFNQKWEEKEKSQVKEEQQGWVGQMREMMRKEEEGKKVEVLVRETFDIKDISPAALFPDAKCPELRRDLTPLVKNLTELTKRLLKCLSLSLGLDKDCLGNMHSRMMKLENNTNLRSIHYPAVGSDFCSSPDILRCGEHTDYGTLTLLIQDQMGGLEVQGKTREWMSVNPMPEAVFLTIGDLLELISGGVYPATRHRVIIPDEVIIRGSSRQSIAFFLHPNKDILCKPLTGQMDSKYQPVTSTGNLRQRLHDYQ